MRLQSDGSFLALHDEPDHYSRRIEISRTLEDALANWSSGSRVSPIWAIDGFSSNLSDAFSGDCRLIFMGPVQPARLALEIDDFSTPAVSNFWVTAGCFNIALCTTADTLGDALAERVREWAEANDVAYEQWALSNGVIGDSLSYVLNGDDTRSILTRLGALSQSHDHPTLRPTLQENVIATATSLARSAAIYPPIFENFSSVADATCKIMESFKRDELSILDMQSRLLSLNAAISRFSSQAFSGIPPILGTECHFWIHSLLGTGSANIALANLVSFIQQILGEARLSERLSLLIERTDNVPSLENMTDSQELLAFNILGDKLPDTISSEPIIPLVTYFSGRDGFSSHLQTLSAPLTTLAECNSLRSNILTVTHEISHIFVQSALAELSPTPSNADDMKWARQLLSPHYQAANFLEAARQLLLEAIIGMEQTAREPLVAQEIEEELPQILGRWRQEVQEILVHSFDFLYFHSGNPDYYVRNIWHSWCSIPSIADRVPEYLMRTLCAVSSSLLTERPDRRFEAALRGTKKILQEVAPEVGVDHNYVEQVLNYIEQLESNPQLREKIERDYSVRIWLVRLVKIFLFSETLAAKLFADPHIGGGSGYRTKKNLHYDTNPVGNPLQFLATQLKANPSEVESIWVLHCLVFDRTLPKRTPR